MKARNLEILKEQGFPVPRFILVSENEEVTLSFSEKEYFAVRSNFSSEDSGEHSFAGQFLTRLNVKREKVKEAVQEVFASYAGSLDYKEKANRGKAEYDLKQQGKAEQYEDTERQENTERQGNAERQEDTEQKKQYYREKRYSFRKCCFRKSPVFCLQKIQKEFLVKWWWFLDKVWAIRWWRIRKMY